jgi:DNA-directed RNA polymerase-3 subunit RPC5
MARPVESDDEDDPIVAEYDVYITPESDDHLYLLQYPNRDRDMPYNERNQSAPTEMRIKPQTGFLEVDVDFGFDHSHFIPTKGVMWGDAIKTARESGLNAYGVASGFGKGGRINELSAASAQRQPADEAAIDDMAHNLDLAVENGSILDKQTFGGQIIRPEPRQPTYMLGAFRGSEFHVLIDFRSSRSRGASS